MASPSFSPQFCQNALQEAGGLLVKVTPPRSLNPPADLAFRKVLTDTRKIGPGDCFVAIKGETLDGHDFIEPALEAGAAGVLANRPCPPELAGRAWHFEVTDSLQAFRTLAHAWRKQFKIPFVCVAGSVGKTTTKELLASLLSGRFESIVKTQGSQNGYLGIPITLMDVAPQTEIAVIEVGIDEIGAMQAHLKLLEPTHTVLTALGPEHLEKLIDLKTVAAEEGIALVDTHARGMKTFVNQDDPWIAPIALKLSGSPAPIRFSLGEPASGLVTGAYDPAQGTLHVRPIGSPAPFALSCPLQGEHNARNLLAAAAIALDLGLDPEQIRRGLSSFSGEKGRSRLEALPSFGVHALCDYYNSNPTSVEAALKLLAQESAKTARNGLKPRRIACLGDMLELGLDEEAFHRGLASPLLAASIDAVYLFGPRMRWLVDELLKRGYKAVRGYDDKKALARDLALALKRGDWVLIKGSRGMRMEEVWQELQNTQPAS